MTCSSFDKSEARGDIIGVSLVKKSCQEPRNIIAVKKRPPNWSATHQFAMCPSVTFGNYSDLGNFVQYMEVNGMFGGDFVTLYNYSISPTLKPYIDYYKSMKRVEVVQWNLPLTSNGRTVFDDNNEVFYFAQAASMSDCLYRAYLSSKFVVFLDFDEVIVPLNGAKKWLDFMPKDNKFGAYQIRSTFFLKECNRDSKFLKDPLVQPFSLKVFQYFLRNDKILPYGKRSKWIGRPERVRTAETHYPGSLRNSIEYFVPETKALLFHYRFFQHDCTATTVLSEKMLTFKDDILTRLQNLSRAVTPFLNQD